MGRISNEDAQRLGIDETARAVHENAMVVDLHVDSILQQRFFRYDLAQEHAPGPLVWKERTPRSLPFELARLGAWATGHDHPFFNHADIPRMRRAGYDGVGLGLHYWPRQSEGGWREIQRQIDYFDELLADEHLYFAGSPEQMRDARAKDRLGAFVALEGLHALGEKGQGDRRLARIEALYRRGVRYITLAHLGKNDAVHHCFGPGSKRDVGLSAFGREVVSTMNDLGMVVDVSHVSHQGVLEVCRHSRAPVIASHTALRGSSSAERQQWRARNLEDEALLAIAETGGVVGLFLAPQFLTGGPCSVDALSDQVLHGIRVLEAAGYVAENHFALGSDFDGWIATIPTPMQDIADMPLLTQTLLSRGVPQPLTQGLLGENFLRVWQRVQDTSRKAQLDSTTPVSESS